VSKAEARISPRLRDALVADLVMEDLDPDGDGAYWLTVALKHEEEWTEHLARQLGFSRTDGPSDLHQTLLLIVRELDDMLRHWPPPHEDSSTCRKLAHDATKSLTPLELYATFLAGPTHWRAKKVDACKIDKLPAQLQPILERALAAELSRVLGQWVKWDTRKLKERRREAIKAAEAARAEAEREVARKEPYRRQADKDRWDRTKPLYRPPGRT
jgi:hypothetical protein